MGNYGCYGLSKVRRSLPYVEDQWRIFSCIQMNEIIVNDSDNEKYIHLVYVLNY